MVKLTFRIAIEQINLVRYILTRSRLAVGRVSDRLQVSKVSTKAPFHVSSSTGDAHVAVIGRSNASCIIEETLANYDWYVDCGVK